MDKNRFRDLLTDLYEKYNKAHLIYLDELVTRNHDSPFPAIDSIFLKYNHPSMSHYDPVKSTDQYKIDLMKEYEKGNRIFKEVDLAQEASLHRKEEVKEQKDESRKEVEDLMEKKVTAVSQAMGEKMEKEVQEATKKAIDAFQKFMDDGVDYTVTMDGVGEEVILPNKRHLAALGINSRMVVRSKDPANAKPIGLIIKDICYDSFSLEGKVIVSIHLERG